MNEPVRQTWVLIPNGGPDPATRLSNSEDSLIYIIRNETQMREPRPPISRRLGVFVWWNDELKHLDPDLVPRTQVGNLGPLERRTKDVSQSTFP
jgi:hypothetical protein